MLGAELAKAGVPVRAGYPVGDWQVDLCAGTGDAAVGLVCAVHPDGPAAHIERQETLARAGWRLVDAYPSRWGGDAVRAALDLAPRLGPAAAPALSPAPPQAGPGAALRPAGPRAALRPAAPAEPAAPSGEADGVELL